MKKYLPIVGLEIHVELRTNSKMFCGCPAEHFGKVPNTQTCPVCLGLPGALPYPNEKAVEWAIMIGLALKCSINKTSKFDRKHYFYPDLPKGYQISQYDEPLCVNGQLSLVNGRIIRIRRVHIEEDTGKLQHTTIDGEKVSLIDFNRSGVPLVEIVTEPDIHSASEAKKFTQNLQQIIRYLEVSDCDMEKGSMRLEANVSLTKAKDLKTKELENRSTITNLPNYKVEVKNINSFRFLEKAIDYEIERQEKLLAKGEVPKQETRGWSEARGITLPQRYKETEADYRYFPEPDIPPMEFNSTFINQVKKQIPELPFDILYRLTKKYGIRQDYAEVLVAERNYAAFAEEAFELARRSKIDCSKVAGYLVNTKINIKKITPKDIVEKLKKKKEATVIDAKLLESWIDEAISSLPRAVSDYEKGKTNAIAVLIGYVMRVSKGKADATIVRKMLEKKLQ